MSVSIEGSLAAFVTGLTVGDMPASTQHVLFQMNLAVIGAGFAGAGEDGVGALRQLLLDTGGTPQA